jgi:hypothetical protein
MNNKIIVSVAIAIIITITIIIFSLTQNEEFDEAKETKFKETTEIENMLQEIVDNKKVNDSSLNPYSPAEREWNKSGPFLLDRNEYVLGERLFVNLEYLDKNTKGEMIFTKIINNTHSYEYKKIKFDGSKPQYNFYIGMNLNMPRGLCNVDQLIGNWELRFEGTNYESIKFKVLDEILPGSERLYEPVC